MTPTRSRIVDDARLLGRSVIDITGNGPSTSGERIACMLRIGPARPRYHCSGNIFVSSHPAHGLLTATLTASSDVGVVPPGTPYCRIETACGTERSGPARSADLDGSLLTVDPDLLWHDPGGLSTAAALARLARLLVYAEADPDCFETKTDIVVLADGRSDGVASAMTLLRIVLACGGYDGNDQGIDVYLPTPSRPVEIVPRNIDAAIPATLLQALRSSFPKTVTIHASRPDASVIARCRLHASIADTSPMDRLRLIGGLGLRPEVLDAISLVPA